jgi:predicted Zn-dependent peptidase
MKVILRFNDIPEGHASLLKNAKSWLNEYGLKIEDSSSSEKDLLWMLDPNINKNLEFLFMMEEEDTSIIARDENHSKHIEEMNNILERISQMSEPLTDEETSNFLRSIAKNIDYLNKDNEKILQEINKLNYNIDESFNDISVDGDLEEAILEDELYKEEIIERIQSVTKDEPLFNIIEILLEYIDEEELDEVVYKKLKSID